MERRTSGSRLLSAHAKWALLAVALVVSGCADDSAPSLDPDLEGTMTVAPASATPGQEVALRFPSGNQRGIVRTATTVMEWASRASVLRL